jgi:hypothetical protein
MGEWNGGTGGSGGVEEGVGGDWKKGRWLGRKEENRVAMCVYFYSLFYSVGHLHATD